MSSVMITAYLVSAVVAGPPASSHATMVVAQEDEPACAHAKTAVKALSTDRIGEFALLGLGDTDLQHYALDIEVDPGAAWLGGSNTMTVRSTIDGLATFHFRLDDVFTIDTLTVDGVAAAWERLDGATIAVTLASPYDVDDVFTLAVGYAGYPDGGGFGSIVFRSRSGQPESWTLSEPWFSHTWWPVKDDNTDKSTADLWFTVPDGLLVASNGLLQGVDDMGSGLVRFRWKTEYQTADYLYCYGITNYDTFGTTWDYGVTSMPLEFYIYPEDNTPGHRASWLENTDMLDVFSDHYGLYPFAAEKYGMCQTGFGGGMEHQTMTSQGGFWESTTAHELAHQWFGDMITCATWHDIWLNEGFATWSEAVWYGNKPGSTMQGYHDRMEARRPGSVNGSVYVWDATDVGRIFSGDFTYRKAAWVLHMLRHVVTDELWWDVLAAYRDAFQFGSATTEDFRAIVENVSGRNLDWFFQQWVYDIGAPKYRTAWVQHDVAGRRFVELFIEQTQSASYPIFSMPLDVEVNGDSVHVVWNDAQQEHLLFEVAESVSAVVLDPEIWVLEIGKQTTSFPQGPPKIVETMPAPGAVERAGMTDDLRVTFHKDVIATADAFGLAGESLGAIAFEFEYDAPTKAAILTPVTALLPDTYTLTIADTVLDVASGQGLDGEIGAADDPESLPSGDGLAGGVAEIRFDVLAAGDVDGDGLVDTTDLLAVLGAWGPCDACPEDLDGDGTVGVGDLLLVLSSWTT